MLATWRWRFGPGIFGGGQSGDDDGIIVRAGIPFGFLFVGDDWGGGGDRRGGFGNGRWGSEERFGTGSGDLRIGHGRGPRRKSWLDGGTRRGSGGGRTRRS